MIVSLVVQCAVELCEHQTQCCHITYYIALNETTHNSWCLFMGLMSTDNCDKLMYGTSNNQLLESMIVIPVQTDQNIPPVDPM